MQHINENQVQTNQVETENLRFEDYTPQVVSEDKDYKVIKNEDGKFERKAKYEQFSSVPAESKSDKIWLFNLLEGNSEDVYGMKENVGKTFEIANIILSPYDSIDENTGEITPGVLTYLLDPDYNAYVTSSKSVYFTVKRIMDVFGTPNDNEWENIKVEINQQRSQNGNMIKIKMVG